MVPTPNSENDETPDSSSQTPLLRKTETPDASKKGQQRLRILAVFVILVGSILGAMLPWLLVRNSQLGVEYFVVVVTTVTTVVLIISAWR